MKNLHSFCYFCAATGGWFLLADKTASIALGFVLVVRRKTSTTTGAGKRNKKKNVSCSLVALSCSFSYPNVMVGNGNGDDCSFYSCSCSTTSRWNKQSRRRKSCRCFNRRPRPLEEEPLVVRNRRLIIGTNSTSTSTTNTIATSTGTNTTWIHIGNIHWHMECERVERYLRDDLFKNLSIVTFYLKPKSNKPRDDSKYHGGSVKIEFETSVDAQQAMERLQQTTTTTTTTTNNNNNSGDSSIGQLRFHWMVNPQHQPSTYLEDTQNKRTNELSTLERIQHRKKRAEKYARQRLKRGEETDALLKILEPLWEVRPFTVMDVLDAPELDWDSVPWEIDPVRGGGLRHGTLRGSRKQAQVEAILYVLRTLYQDYPDETKKDEIASTTLDSQKKIVIADLASGAGNLSLPLAWFLKDIHATVLAVDINPRALERLSKRAEDIGVEIQTLVQDLEKLSSVEVVGRGETTMDYLMNLNCQAIVSLHACGAASDLAIEAAVARDLPFVVSPCCIAKANHVRKGNNIDSHKGEIVPNLISSQRSGAPVRITYPRSKELETFCVERAVLNDYPLIMTAADYSTGENAKHNVIHQQRGKMSKHIVELDRLKWAEERGYYTRIISIPRLGIYPKKELLLGAKWGSKAAKRLSSLPSMC